MRRRWSLLRAVTVRLDAFMAARMLFHAVWWDRLWPRQGVVITRKGTVMACYRGHPMCEALADIRLGEFDWGQKLGNWRQGITPPTIGGPIPTCPACGSILMIVVGSDLWDGGQP